MTIKTSYIVNDTFLLSQSLLCGQCFRWEALGNEHFRGVAFGRELELSLTDNVLSLSCSTEDFESLWRNYLDLDRDYAAIRRRVSIDTATAQAVDYGAGIRILRQEPWEALCSFILSQCNNIPRIRAIISRMCAAYGQMLREGVYTFPAPDILAAVDPAHFAEITRCGYRAAYVIEAARAVREERLSLPALLDLPTREAKTALCALPGIGEKVANCILLFGLGKLDAFPVDVWMRRAVQALYGTDFDAAKAFGAYAGIAQQYIFYHTRETQKSKKPAR